MMQLSVIDANDQLIEAELDGKIFHVGLSWNEEGQFWSMSLRDLNRLVLASGIAVIPNYPLLNQIRRTEFPDGEFGVGLANNQKLDRYSFVNNFAGLFYYSPADLV